MYTCIAIRPKYFVFLMTPYCSFQRCIFSEYLSLCLVIFDGNLFTLVLQIRPTAAQLATPTTFSHKCKLFPFSLLLAHKKHHKQLFNPSSKGTSPSPRDV